MRILVLILFLVPMISFAKNIEIAFEYETEYSGKVNEHIKLIESRLYLNNRELDPIQWQVNHLDFQMILGKFKSNKNCKRDKFVLSKKVDGVETIESGCVGDKRYLTLVKAFNKIKADIPKVKTSLKP